MVRRKKTADNYVEIADVEKKLSEVIEKTQMCMDLVVDLSPRLKELSDNAKALSSDLASKEAQERFMESFKYMLSVFYGLRDDGQAIAALKSLIHIDLMQMESQNRQ